MNFHHYYLPSRFPFLKTKKNKTSSVAFSPYIITVDCTFQPKHCNKKKAKPDK